MGQQPTDQLVSLDILCIGEVGAGKSYFLKQYTRDQQIEQLYGLYDIFVKKIDQTVVYFYELSEEQRIYLQHTYDGILFFIDFVDTWNVLDNILKWMELQSKFTGQNIFKIPIRVVVTKTRAIGDYDKWKKSLEAELASIVAPHQIIYFQSIQQMEEPLTQYYRQIKEGIAPGIKQTKQNHFRLYGVTESLKSFITNARLTFFRCCEIFDKQVRSRIAFNMKHKTN